MRDLGQLSLEWDDRPTPSGDLELIPFRFRYRFHCDDDSCNGHHIAAIDWEVGQSYRSWRRRYGESGWRGAMRQKYLEELPEKDLHFVVGTHRVYQSWMIVGLIYPPRVEVLEPQQASALQDPREREPMTLPLFGLEAEEGDGPLPGESEDHDQVGVS